MAAGRLDLVIVGPAGQPEAGPRGPILTPILVPNPYKTCRFLRILVILVPFSEPLAPSRIKNKWPIRARRGPARRAVGPQE